MASSIQTNKFKRKSQSTRTLIDGHTLNYRKGNDWYVDASRSASGLDGTSWDNAFLTMAEAFAKLASGDSIYFVGKIQEQLITPVQIFDVRVIGMGNRPRHADSTPSGGNTHASTWAAKASPDAATALVQVLQQGWVFENILFAGSAGCPSINLVRNAASGNSERDASHAIIRGCRFAGVASTDTAIKFGATSYSEIVGNTLIEDNDFVGCATALGQNAPNLAYRTKVIGNRFQANTNDINGLGYNAHILNNVMSLAPTKCIFLSADTGSNQVHGNYLCGTYANGTLYAPASSDNWNGNFTGSDAQTASAGVSYGVPD